jgi:hypothetical protein
MVGAGQTFRVAQLKSGSANADVRILRARRVSMDPASTRAAVSLHVGEPVYAIAAPQRLE